MHKRPIQLIANATDSANNHFSVKLSLFICMLAACSGSPPQCSTFSSNTAFMTENQLLLSAENDVTYAVGVQVLTRCR